MISTKPSWFATEATTHLKRAATLMNDEFLIDEVEWRQRVQREVIMSNTYSTLELARVMNHTNLLMALLMVALVVVVAAIVLT